MKVWGEHENSMQTPLPIISCPTNMYAGVLVISLSIERWEYCWTLHGFICNVIINNKNKWLNKRKMSHIKRNNESVVIHSSSIERPGYATLGQYLQYFTHTGPMWVFCGQATLWHSHTNPMWHHCGLAHNTYFSHISPTQVFFFSSPHFLLIGFTHDRKKCSLPHKIHNPIGKNTCGLQKFQKN